MDQIKDSHARYRIKDEYPAEGADERRANEAVAQIVAYTSPYLFWAMVAGLTVGIFALR